MTRDAALAKRDEHGLVGAGTIENGVAKDKSLPAEGRYAGASSARARNPPDSGDARRSCRLSSYCRTFGPLEAESRWNRLSWTSYVMGDGTIAPALAISRLWMRSGPEGRLDEHPRGAAILHGPFVHAGVEPADLDPAALRIEQIGKIVFRPRAGERVRERRDLRWGERERSGCNGQQLLGDIRPPPRFGQVM